MATFKRVFIGDSNVGRFWTEALADRAAVRSNCFYLPCDDLVTLEQLAALVNPRLDAVILSVITNPIREAVASLEHSESNVRDTVSASLRDILVLQIFPLCSSNKTIKVTFSLS